MGDVRLVTADMAALAGPAAVRRALGGDHALLALQPGRIGPVALRRGALTGPGERRDRGAALGHPHLQRLPPRHRHRRRGARPGRRAWSCPSCSPRAWSPGCAAWSGPPRLSNAARSPTMCRPGATRSGACRPGSSPPRPSCAGAPTSATGRAASSTTSSPPPRWCPCATTWPPRCFSYASPNIERVPGHRRRRGRGRRRGRCIERFHPDTTAQLRDALVAGAGRRGERLEIAAAVPARPDVGGLARGRGACTPLTVAPTGALAGTWWRTWSTCRSGTRPSGRPRTAASSWSRSSTPRPTPSWCATSTGRVVLASSALAAGDRDHRQRGLGGLVERPDGFGERAARGPRRARRPHRPVHRRRARPRPRRHHRPPARRRGAHLRDAGPSRVRPGRATSPAP